MDIYRCPRCDEPLAAYVTIPPGLGYLPFSHSTVERQVAARLRDHAQSCAALRDADPSVVEEAAPAEPPPRFTT